MKYALLVYECEEDFDSREDQRSREYWAAYSAFTTAMQEAGVLSSGSAALKEPGVATTVRVRPDGTRIQDGPFADTREQLGGLFVIECDDLDAALKWAARCPSASTASVEVRPILEM